MQVSKILVLFAVFYIATAKSQECFNGQISEVTTNFLGYCYHEEWRWICYQDSQWNHEKTISVCTHLGYSALGVADDRSECGIIQRKVVRLTNCNEPGQNLTECMVTASDSCTICSYLFLTCSPVDCTDGALRLMSGPTDREGRVEVCVGGRQWRTVCTGSQELAGAVCSQMGYIFEESTVALPNSFTPGAFPEYRLDCTQLSNGTWHCSPFEQQCDSFLELGVVCKNYEDLYNEYSTNSTLLIFPVTTTQSPTTSQEMYFTPRETTTNNGSSTSLLAVIAVLVVLQAATMIALISTCVVFKKKLKQKVTMATQQADLTYAVVGGTQTEMKVDPNIAANPAYEAVKCDQEDHTYDVVSDGVDPRQRRGN